MWEFPAGGSDWAASFLLAQTPSDAITTRIRGGGPGISLDTVWWFVSTDEIETADAEVKGRMAIANNICGTDLSEQRVAENIRARRNVLSGFRAKKATDATDPVRSQSGVATCRLPDGG
jgi:hypothetical protein